jgi:NitT/TauT family transport system substrate-binding protein
MDKWLFDEMNRREFMKRAALTGAAAYLGVGCDYSFAAAEPPPETTSIKFSQMKPACWAPQYMAEDLLYKEEGFTDVQYVKRPKELTVKDHLASGEADFSVSFSARLLSNLIAGDDTVFISGLHVGCYYLLGSEHVRSVRDLKGKTVWAWSSPGSGPHIFFKTIVAYVGLDPDKDINYAWVPMAEAKKLFTEGKLDGFISFPPAAQELRAKNIGRVLVDTNVDRPWSQYFCCLIVARRSFIKENPIATKRALRAVLKANDLVAQDPEAATRKLIEKEVRKESEFEYVKQSLQDIPYHKWRDYNPEETIRFYSLRLRELGLTKENPQDIITQNTDWRFLESLREELNIKYV